ncbi:MAG: hypothetical protein IJO14_03680 [Clostridia bacterium]|nr:hypothetical protein [Clostridia bacterium]
MKRIVSIFLTCIMLFVLSSCGEQVTEPTDSVNEPTQQAISDGDVMQTTSEVTTESASEPVATTASVTELPSDAETATTVASSSEEATLPVLEEYTFVGDSTKNVANYTFEGEKIATKTCNKIIMKNDDGATQLSISFAEDGSGLTVFTLNPDGTKYTTLARFDKDGKLVGIFNGSGAYTDYTYGNNTCVQQVYDANGVQIDYRKYYYDENEITQKVERGDGTQISEVYNYTVDAEGKVVSLRVENDTGYLLYEYTYNEQGLAERRRIEENDTFYGIQLYTYDENGKRDSYSFRNDENGPHELDMTVYYNNVYDADGTYLGTAEYDSVTGEVYIAVAYDYVTTDYPHYAQFLEDHFMTY